MIPDRVTADLVPERRLALRELDDLFTHPGWQRFRDAVARMRHERGERALGASDLRELGVEQGRAKAYQEVVDEGYVRKALERALA